MTISFNHIPANIRVPLFYAEMDPSQAGTGVVNERAFLIGTMLAAGSATADVPIRISGKDAAIAATGRGSQLARMVEFFRKGNSNHDLWILPVAEPGAGVAATGTVTATGTATESGTLSIYIAGQRVQVAITVGDVQNTVATNIQAALAANLDIPVTAAVNGGTANQVDLTCRWKGETGNDIRVEMNYRGTLGGEKTPAGVTIVIGAMSGGTAAPSLAAGIANMGDTEFDAIGMPFTDTASLDALKAELSDQDGGRWSWERQIYGHVYAYKRDTFANLATAGNARNNGHESLPGIEAGSPSPVWEWVGAAVAQASRALLNDPARPLQTLPLVGILPAKREDRFTLQERNTLLHDGISTHFVGDDDTVRIERMITTFQTNEFGVEDNALLDVNTLSTLARVLRTMKQRITSKYPRHKLANDGTRFGAGQAIVTPNIIKAELVAHYGDLELQGLVENMKAFKNNLIVERNQTDPTRLDVLYPPDLVNQLRIFAVLAQFRLQYPTETNA